MTFRSKRLAERTAEQVERAKKSLLDDVSEEEIERYKKRKKEKHLAVRLTCKICKGVFATASNLRRHMKKIHQTGKPGENKTLSADAPQKTSTTTNMEQPQRVNIMGSKKTPTQRCVFCDLDFEHYFLFEIHRCPRLPENSKKIHCQCKKTFNSNASFEFHSFFHDSIVEIGFFDT